jgi:hypothetical protein
MRDVMEIELLLREFAADLGRLDAWRSADDRTLRRDFSPDAVRKRLAGPGLELPDGLEYKHHSEALHPVPNPPDLDTYSRELTTTTDVGTLARHSLELLEHGRRVLDAMDEILDAGGVAGSDRPPRAPDRERMRHAYRALFEHLGAASAKLIEEGHLPPRIPQQRGAARTWREAFDKSRQSNAGEQVTVTEAGQEM